MHMDIIHSQSQSVCSALADDESNCRLIGARWVGVYRSSQIVLCVPLASRGGHVHLDMDEQERKHVWKNQAVCFVRACCSCVFVCACCRSA